MYLENVMIYDPPTPYAEQRDYAKRAKQQRLCQFDLSLETVLNTVYNID